MIRGIHHVGIHTSDLDRLRAFYEQAFGFEAIGEEIDLADVPEAAQVIGMERTAARCLMMKAHNCFVELFEWSDPVGDRRDPLNANDLGYTHFMVDVEDIEAEYARLSALGMTFVGPAPVRFGNNGSIYGHDPDGNIIEIGEIPAGEDLHLEVGGER